MVLYTNQPYELIFPDDSVRTRNIVISDGIIEAMENDDGKYYVQRLISTNPMAYLKSDYSPGSSLGCSNFNS